jgi:hypothetical protein
MISQKPLFSSFWPRLHPWLGWAAACVFAALWWTKSLPQADPQVVHDRGPMAPRPLFAASQVRPPAQTEPRHVEASAPAPGSPQPPPAQTPVQLLMSRLRSASPVTFQIQRHPLHQVVKTLVDQAGIDYQYCPSPLVKDGRDILVTCSATAPPYVIFENICNNYGLRITPTDDGVFRIEAIDDSSPVTRRFMVKDLSKLESISEQIQEVLGQGNSGDDATKKRPFSAVIDRETQQLVVSAPHADHGLVDAFLEKRPVTRVTNLPKVQP